MSKENAAVFLQVHVDDMEVGKEKLTVSKGHKCSDFDL